MSVANREIWSSDLVARSLHIVIGDQECLVFDQQFRVMTIPFNVPKWHIVVMRRAKDLTLKRG